MSFYGRDALVDQLVKHLPLAATAEKLLPANDLSVASLQKFPVPSVTSPSGLLQRDDLFQKTSSYLQNDETSTRLVLSLPCPSLESLRDLAPKALLAHQDGYISFIYKMQHKQSTVDLKLPLWVFTYWYTIRCIMEIRDCWAGGLRWLEARMTNADAARAHSALETFPWGFALPRALGAEATSLVRFLGHRWLNEANVDQLLQVFKSELLSSAAATQPPIILNYIAIRKLTELF